LESPELAKQRVKIRVSEGGHNIPEDVIERRYERGLKNLFEIYLPLCDNTMLFDNSDRMPILVMKKVKDEEAEIIDFQKFKSIQNGKE